MARVVIDANVWVSAAFRKISYKAILKVFREQHEVYISSQIREELLSLPAYLESKLTKDKVEFLKVNILGELLKECILMEPQQRLNICRDVKDNMYLSFCLEVRADVLITGDKDLIEMKKEELNKAGLGFLKIVSPGGFLKLKINRRQK